MQGRGELALAVLVEIMRREGFEITVGKPEVLTKVIDGVLCEPMERLSVEVPEEHLGTVTQLLAKRKAKVERIVHHGTGWVRLDHLVPARGLIGVRGEMLTGTRGTAQLHHAFENYEPWQGEIRTRTTGSMISDRRGVTTAYALAALTERGTMFVGAGEEVYEGMIVGESARPEDMDVNPTREKKLTNTRSSTSDELVRLPPHRKLSLEQALEQADESECVEVTPTTVRLRKAVLSQAERGRTRGRERRRHRQADPRRSRVLAPAELDRQRRCAGLCQAPRGSPSRQLTAASDEHRRSGDQMPPKRIAVGRRKRMVSASGLSLRTTTTTPSRHRCSCRLGGHG